MQRLPLVLALLALVLSLFTLLRGEEDAAHTAQAVDHHGEHIEIAVHMGRIQRYHQKLWAAGREGNAELAAFYLHELEEAMEEIAEADVEEDGVRISPHMKAYGLGTVEALERILKEDGVEALHASSQLLVDACNACHAATGYSFIRIQVPGTVHYPDQDFAPRK